MSKALKILYVDDEPDIREIVAIALGLDPEIELRTAASGPEALGLLDLNVDWHPDIYLLDVMMPGMSGLELMNRLKQRPQDHDVPAVMVTASARQADLGRYVEAGAAGVICKPFDPMTFAQKVRGFLH